MFGIREIGRVGCRQQSLGADPKRDRAAPRLARVRRDLERLVAGLQRAGEVALEEPDPGEEGLEGAAMEGCADLVGERQAARQVGLGGLDLVDQQMASPRQP